MTFTISPTQVETFAPEYEGCERKWAFRKIDKIPAPPNRYAREGLDLHDVAEKWLRDGTPPDLSTKAGKAFNGGMHHLPPPGSVRVEDRARFEYLGIHYDQRLDAWHSPKPGLIEVIDHKSTGDLRWAEEKCAKLDTDPQWLMYAAWSVIEHDARAIDGKWIFYLRKPPWSSRVLTVTANEWQIVEAFEKHIHPVSQRILQALQEPSSARPKNLAACGRYGGCPYRDRCLTSVPKRLASMTTHNDLNAARARLAARANTVKPSKGPLAARLQAYRAAQEVGTTELAAEPKRGEVKETASDEGVSADAAAGTVEEKVEEVLSAAKEGRLDVHPVEPEPAARTEEKPKRGRGRPRKAKDPDGSSASSKALVEPKTEEKPKRGRGRPKKDKGEGSKSTVEQDYRDRCAALDSKIDTIEGARMSTLVQLHVAAIAAHQPPEVANTHYRAIVDLLEQGT